MQGGFASANGRVMECHSGSWNVRNTPTAPKMKPRVAHEGPSKSVCYEKINNPYVHTCMCVLPPWSETVRLAVDGN